MKQAANSSKILAAAFAEGSCLPQVDGRRGCCFIREPLSAPFAFLIVPEYYAEAERGEFNTMGFGPVKLPNLARRGPRKVASVG